MFDPVLFPGVTYHGSTADSLSGFENVWGKHISAARLKQHLSYYLRNYSVVGLQETMRTAREGKLLPSKPLFIAFHDGYLGNYEVAFPILKELGVTASFFLPTAYIDGKFRFWVDCLDAAIKHSKKSELTSNTLDGLKAHSLRDEKDRLETAFSLRRYLKTLSFDDLQDEMLKILNELGFTEPDEVPSLGHHEAPMTWDMVRQMSEAGMEFGSHTHHHVIMGCQPEEVVRSEMMTSKDLIEKATGKPCELFCYPNGQYPHDGNNATDTTAFNLGYKASLYMMGAFNLLHPKTFRLTGIAFGEDSTIPELRRKLSLRRYYQKMILGKRIRPWKNDTIMPSAI